jgi:SAM-dependent methyltransferase
MNRESNELQLKRLHLGCGRKIMPGWINVDSVQLSGVDVVHNLSQFPWPFDNESIHAVYMRNVLEHLPDTIKTMEELYRICRPGANVYIAVPYWNSFESITDPTHIHSFNEYTFEFFDPSHWRCKKRSYYSFARFRIEKIGYRILPFKPAMKIPYITREYIVYDSFWKRILQILSSYFNNIIISLEVYLKRDDNKMKNDD